MAIPFFNNINLDDNQLQNAKVHVTSNAPTAAKGQVYLDSTAGVNTLKYHNGASWIELIGATVTNVGSSTTDQLTVANQTSTPSITVVTGAVADGGSALATGDQIHTFVTGITNGLDNYSNWVVSDGSISQIISSGNTLTVSGTGPISTAVSATDTVTISLDAQAQSNTTIGSATVAYGGAFTVIDTVTRTAKGIVSGVNLKTITLPASDNTDVNVTVANLKTRLSEITGSTTIGGTTVIIPGNLEVTGTVTTNNVETVSTSNGIVFEGSAVDAHEGTLLAGTLTGDRTYTLPDATGVVALTSDLPTVNNASIIIQGNSGLTGSGTITMNQSGNETITIQHADTSSQASVDNSGLSVIQDVTLDTYGHITALGTVDLTSSVSGIVSGNQYKATITDSVSGTDLQHNLGDDVIVQLFDNVTKDTIFADVVRNGNYLNITFASTPTNSIRVLVQKIG